MKRLIALVMLACCLVFCATQVFADTTTLAAGTPAPSTAVPSMPSLGGLPAVSVKTGSNGAQEYSVSLQILLLMTALTFIPAFVIMMTSFTRIIIVFSILRQALGLQQSPSNQILIGLALFLSLFIMSPVLNKINEQAYT
ncbi:MAG TPA: flagellar biosynthetic protein FliP, partial [Cellvibrionaceae bacterium]|nr:flagellar biosynthetic protein FliP [Cellvibrionaceae bacterium]